MKRAIPFLLSLPFLLVEPVWADERHEATEAGHEHQTEAREDGHEHEEDHSRHEGQAEGIRAVHAWIQATSGRTALLFVEIENASGNDISITGGETEVAESVELVGFQLKGGEADYAVLPAVPVKAGRELMLAPNGLALRLNGLKRGFEKGEEFEIEIEFDFGHIEMHAQVEDATATHHSHAGHQH